MNATQQLLKQQTEESPVAEHPQNPRNNAHKPAITGSDDASGTGSRGKQPTAPNAPLTSPSEIKHKQRRASVKEADLQRQVLQLARICGWRTAHFRPAQNQRGKWRTAVSGDGAGFPDLVLTRDDHLLFVELKQDGRYPTATQRAWHDALRAAGADVRIWRPADWPDIEATLKRPERTIEAVS